MSASLRLRLLTEADLPFADSIRAVSGWNQTLQDWRRFLEIAPGGCFLAEWDGVPAGTATTTVYGSELAWIGMVLVAPECRRRGIGRALLGHCVDYLKGEGVRCIKLDATPLGKTLYDGLGFSEEWTFSRWAGSLQPVSPTPPSGGIRSWAQADLSAMAALEADAFGCPRPRLLRLLAEGSLAGLVWESGSGGIGGYGLVRPGARAWHLGPVAAQSVPAGLGLVESLAGKVSGQLAFWDIPESNDAAATWARAHGFKVQRPLTRMFLGENGCPGDPSRHFALAGPEVG